jgi:hypothetical protein
MTLQIPLSSILPKGCQIPDGTGGQVDTQNHRRRLSCADLSGLSKYFRVFYGAMEVVLCRNTLRLFQNGCFNIVVDIIGTNLRNRSDTLRAEGHGGGWRPAAVTPLQDLSCLMAGRRSVRSPRSARRGRSNAEESSRDRSGPGCPRPRRRWCRNGKRSRPAWPSPP